MVCDSESLGQVLPTFQKKAVHFVFSTLIHMNKAFDSSDLSSCHGDRVMPVIACLKC